MTGMSSHWLNSLGLSLAIALIISFSVFAEENLKLDEGEALPRSELSEENYKQIEKILSSEDFARKKTVKRWRFKYLQDDDEEDVYSDSEIEAARRMEGQGSFVYGLASVLEVMLWLLLIFIIGFLIWKYRHQMSEFLSNLGKEDAAPELPTTMFGLDVKKTSMPKDVVESARQHWLNGERRQGIALLLQASLIALLHDHDCRFIDSDTESECCARIEQQAPKNMSSFMRKLVSAWQQIAYAHRAPADQLFDELCQEWREVF